MATSTASDSYELNQYFVETGVGGRPGPLDALVRYYKRNTEQKQQIKSEQERRIQALETQIAELQGQLEPTKTLAETRQTTIEELKKLNQRKDALQAKQGLKITQLQNTLKEFTENTSILEQEIDERDKKITELETRIETQRSEINQLHEYLHKHLEKLELKRQKEKFKIQIDKGEPIN